MRTAFERNDANMADEFDEHKSRKEFEQSRAQYEEFLRQSLDVRMKIFLEGFDYEGDVITIAPELQIRRVPLQEREEFIKRAEAFNFNSRTAKENEFFAFYDFAITRGEVQGPEPGEGIRTISIFFSICGQTFININKGHFFVPGNGEPTSAGIWSIAEYSPFTSHINYKKQDIDQLKVFWPIFKKEYQENSQFALVARRYFFSEIRLQWQDKLIDLMIALEAMLIPENLGPKGEKIAHRLPRLLSQKFESKEVASMASEAYKLRNDVVHGKRADHKDGREIYVKGISALTKCAIQEYLLKYPGLTSADLVKVLESK